MHRKTIVDGVSMPYTLIGENHEAVVCEVVDVTSATCDVPPALLMRAAVALQHAPEASAAVIGVQSCPCELVAVYRYERESLRELSITLGDDIKQGKAYLSRAHGAYSNIKQTKRY